LDFHPPTGVEAPGGSGLPFFNLDDDIHFVGMGIDAFEFPFFGGVVDKHEGGIRKLALEFLKEYFI
jgi:hypothetical protein